MRRAFYTLLILVLITFVVLPAQTIASIESDIKDIKKKIGDDEQNALTFTCGGLVRGSDDRVSAYYARKEPLECKLDKWCDNYEKSTGSCEGLRCDVVSKQGLEDSYMEEECSDGLCTVPVPHRRCSVDLSGSRYRSYDCGRATAECFTYSPNLSYEQSYFPFAYNCVLNYDETPVDADNEPKGSASVSPAYNVPRINRESADLWDSTPGSNVSNELYEDSSIGPLTLDKASVSISKGVVHPTVDSPMRLGDYPDLERMMSRLLQPPEVRLIMPSHTLTLGTEPDSLLTAAKYLRNIPLLETKYVPVEVAVPFVSATELKVLIKEWEAWENEHDDELNSDVSSRVWDNIATIRSYEAIQDSIRDYRLNFPSYLNALLSYTEGVNSFFNEKWIEYNAGQLESWHQVYENYIPTMKQELRSIYVLASKFTNECLVPACRMDVVPVKEGVHPWDLFPEELQFPLSGELRAWTPESLPLWENVHGRVALRHPFTVLGFPLPDITLDLSEIFIRDPISVPVLKVEMHEINIPYPPSARDVTRLNESDFPLLPEFKFPKLDLSFPELTLPDPKDSLFVVPEAPQADLSVLADALIWQKKRLNGLFDVCNNSDSPETFLVHEYQIYGSERDPAAVRAVSLMTSSYNSKFGSPSITWLTQYPDDYIGCSECTAVRPQRFIRQHMQIDVEWELLQDRLLRAIDEWNAQVRFWSVVPREEIVKETPDRLGDSGLPQKLFQSNN